MTNFSFTEIARGKLGWSGNPLEHTLRINTKSFTLSEDEAGHFNSTRFTNNNGGKRVMIGWAYDAYNQAIRLTPDPNGFTCAVTDSGSIMGNMPSAYRKSGLLVGDYKAVEGHVGVYQLAK